MKGKVYQYNMKGEFIKEWANCNRASVSLELQYSSIMRAINGTLISAGGYLWSRNKVDNCVPRDNKRNIPVVQLDDDGNFVKDWKSASSASKALTRYYFNEKSIIACCDGYRKTALGYKWKFKNEKDKER